MDRDDARAVAPLPLPGVEALATQAGLAAANALPLALFMLGIASATFDLGCVLIKTPWIRPGVTVGDAIEAAGVFVVAALFSRVRRLAGGGAILAGLATVAFAFGHGIHVAANSIHDLAERSGAGDPIGLMDFWDEHAGHYLVESGRVLFAAALLGVAGPVRGAPGLTRGAPGSRAALLTTLGGVAYGFITFASAVEGQTVPLVLPFYLLVAAYGLARARGPAGEAWTQRFFLVAAFTALLFFAIWGIWHHGFPEFTRAGILGGVGGPSS